MSKMKSRTNQRLILRQLGHLFTNKDPPLSAPSSWKVWLYRVVFLIRKNRANVIPEPQICQEKNYRKKLGSCFLFLDKVSPSRFRDEMLDFLGKIGPMTSGRSPRFPKKISSPCQICHYPNQVGRLPP